MIDILYNGNCRFCARVASWIRKKNSPNIKLYNIQEKPWYLYILDINIDDALATIHVVDNNDGEIYVGHNAIIRILDALDYKFSAKIFSVPPFLFILMLTYFIVNKLKHLF